MNSGGNIQQLLFLAMVALAAGSVVVAVFLFFLPSGRADSRLKSLLGESKSSTGGTQSASGRNRDGSRRRQVQESLRLAEEREKNRRKRLTLRMLIVQAGLDISLLAFWMWSALLGVVFVLLAHFFGLPWYVAVLSGLVGLLGLPRWFLGHVRKRRQGKFLRDLPDALDAMVRSLKSGVPLSDALRVIAAEVEPPIGPEFWEVVEGQRVGITMEQGVERMYERVPLQEVNFLSIVLGIQSKTGGNLTEALGNLSKVLRERRRMKGKIHSVSQEAKSSAAIIGALPILIILALSWMNPEYLSPLFSTSIGNMMLVFCGVWMLTGVLVMRQMINLEI